MKSTPIGLTPECRRKEERTLRIHQRRASLQSAEIAQRLIRGGELHRTRACDEPIKAAGCAEHIVVNPFAEERKSRKRKYLSKTQRSEPESDLKIAAAPDDLARVSACDA